jgi:hypothetical protein
MVGATIAAHFVPIQVNTQDGYAAEVVTRFRQVWTPDLRVLGADGFEYHRWNGYLPPAEFTARLLVARAEALLRRHQEGEAAEAYAGVIRGFPTSRAASEARYFAAVAQYKASGEGSELIKGWRQLRSFHPESTWRIKQSFTENP